MWLGDITVGADGSVTDDGSLTASPAAPSDTSSFVDLAANLVDMIHPYKQGVPVNLAISPQTQSFLMIGGVLIGGLLLLNMVRR
ncbi:MAG: hypothetical protein ACRETL_06975 [Gammaproteobacteria bacterium]